MGHKGSLGIQRMGIQDRVLGRHGDLSSITSSITGARAGCWCRTAWAWAATLAAGLMALVAHAAQAQTTPPGPPGAAASTSRDQRDRPAITTGPFAGVKSWGYQLRGINHRTIARSDYDVVVIDYADREKPFSAVEVEAMRTKPDGSRRIVLAYISVGEAERYRSYWRPAWQQAAPAWLGPENPEWRGNFPVRFWDLDWQKIVFGTKEAYLDQIIAAGFDGAYLDRVDVYTTWEKEVPDAEPRMKTFIAALSSYAKTLQAGFLIVQQNAEELLDDDTYLAAIDAVAKEDLLYGENHDDRANPVDSVAHSVRLLRRAARAGKAIMVVEYLCRRDEIAKAERRIARQLGFLPYVGPRTLHQLGMTDEDYCLPPGAMGRRVALLIGSGTYERAPHLSSSAANVKALAGVLRQAGFTEVRERMDLGRDSISQELQRFAETARGAEWAVVYYAGLSLRIDGTNYLLPINARLERPADVGREGIALEEVEIAVSQAKQVRLVLLDACRPNAFLEQMQRRGMSQSAGPGVTVRASRFPVTMGHASRCDSGPAPAATAERGGMDLYTAALVQHIATPGLELPWLMERVKDTVLRATKGAQEPAFVGILPDDAVFTPAAPAGTNSPPPSPSAPPRQR